MNQQLYDAYSLVYEDLLTQQKALHARSMSLISSRDWDAIQKHHQRSKLIGDMLKELHDARIRVGGGK